MPFSHLKRLRKQIVTGNTNGNPKLSVEEIKKIIKDKTEIWMQTVQDSAANKDGVTPESVTALFAEDGILWGTVSQIIRQGPTTINEYFDYFAKIPGLIVTSSENNVTKITDDVYVNNVKVTWVHDKIRNTDEDPLTARMTFVFRRDPTTNDKADEAEKWTIFQLHSSEMPAANTNVKSFIFT